MASLVYIKSILWLAAFGGLGYGLLKLTEPSEEKIAKIKSKYTSTTLNEDEKRKLQFLQKLKESSTDTPVYLKKDKKD